MKRSSLQLFRLVMVVFFGALFIASFAIAGSLTPPGVVGSTMHTLAEIYDSIASATFDSSGIVANQNGSLLGNLKYIESQLSWASASNNIWSLTSGNVGIGTTNPTAKLEVVGTASVSGWLVDSTTLTKSASASDVSLTIMNTAISGEQTHAALYLGNDDFLLNQYGWLRYTGSGAAGGGLSMPNQLQIAQRNPSGELLLHSYGDIVFGANQGNISQASERMRITGGNVGIGIGANGPLTPDQKLDVEGNILASASGNVDIILRSSSATSDDGKFTLRSAGASDLFQIMGGATPTALVNIASSGNVGINNTAPKYRLAVGGSIVGLSGAIYSSVSVNTLGGNIIALNTHASTGAFAAVEARNADSFSSATRLLSLGTGYTTNGAFVQDGGVLDTGSALSGGLSIVAQAAAPIRFYTSGFAAGNERMRIDSAGNVRIGTTDVNAKLEVAGTASISGQVLIGVGSVGTPGIAFIGATNTGFFSTNDIRVAVSGASIAHFSGGSSPGFSLGPTGEIGWSSATFVANDVRLFRDAANTLGLRNSTASQSFHIYNTYTNSSNYQRAKLGWDDSVFHINTENVGGPPGDISIGGALGGANVGIGALAPEQKLEVAGNILASASGNDAELILRSISDDGLFAIRASGAAGVDKLFITSGLLNSPLVTIASACTVANAECIKFTPAGSGTTVSTYDYSNSEFNVRRNTSRISVGSTGTIGYIGAISNHQVDFRQNNSARMSLLTSGDVYVANELGLGTTNVDASLEIRSVVTTANVASISALTLTSGDVFKIVVPASTSTSGRYILIEDINGQAYASLGNGGRLALRRDILSHGADSTCTGTNTPTQGCIDYAESFPTTDATLAAGEIVAVDPINPAFVVRATREHTALGIISTTPAALITGFGLRTGANASLPIEGAVPVALAGRVPVRIIGSVSAGEHLTLSDNPGVAQRATEAGMTIGIALEDSQGPTVLAFVNTTYWAPAIPMLAETAPADGLFASILAWFRDALGIQFGQGSVQAERVQSNQLCVGGRCITEEEFIQVFGTATPTPSVSSGSSSGPEPATGGTSMPNETASESFTLSDPGDTSTPVPTPETDVELPPVEAVMVPEPTATAEAVSEQTNQE